MAQADNVLVLYRDTVVDSTLYGSGETTPFERVQEMRPSRKWIATDDEAAWIGGDAGSTVTADTFAVIAHNCGVATEFRLRLGTDVQLVAPGSPDEPDATGVVYDQTFDAWPPVAGLGFDGFGTSLGGFPVLSDFQGYLAYTLQQLGAGYTYRYWRLDIASATANPDGNFAIGRLMLGLGFQTATNIAYGWEWTWVDPSTITDTESSFLIRRRVKYRELRMSWGILRPGEVYGPMDDFKRIVGTSREVLVVVFPTLSAVERYRTTIYGVPSDNGALSNPYADLYSTTVSLRELR